MHLGDSIVIFILALVLFGPKKLPEIARQVGKLLMEFRRASNEFKLQMDDELRALEQQERQKQLQTPATTPTVEVTAATTPGEAAGSAETAAGIGTGLGSGSGLTAQPPSQGIVVPADSPYARAVALEEAAAESRAREEVPPPARQTTVRETPEHGPEDANSHAAEGAKAQNSAAPLVNSTYPESAPGKSAEAVKLISSPEEQASYNHG